MKKILYTVLMCMALLFVSSIASARDHYGDRGGYQPQPPVVVQQVPPGCFQPPPAQMYVNGQLVYVQQPIVCPQRRHHRDWDRHGWGHRDHDRGGYRHDRY